MKTSEVAKWLCHFQSNVLFLLLLFALNFRTGCGIGEIETHTTIFEENGQLHIPQATFNALIEKESNQCPAELYQLPLLGCELMDNPKREASGFRGQHYLLKFKRFECGSIPPIRVSDVFLVGGIEANDGGLQDLSSSMLEDVPHLEILSLAKHWITKIEHIDHVFNRTRNLRKLYLESNGIISWTLSDEVPNDILPELEELSLSGNPIEYFTNRSFEWLKNSKLKTLILRECNSLMGIDSGMLFPVSASLRTLDLAHSGMGRQLLLNLTNGLKERGNSSIEALGLAQMGITQIPRDLLKPLASSLKYLSLYGNRLSMKHRPQILRQADIDFPYLPYLEELDLRSAGVKFLPYDILKPLPNLTTLLLGMNEIMQLKSENFMDSENLRFLSITQNSIHTGAYLDLGSEVFSGLPRLKYLDLSSTPLTPLKESTFVGLSELEELSLYSTKLRSLPDGIFSELENLRVLNISENSLEDLHPNAFEGLSGLKEMYATKCNLNFSSVNLSYFSNLQILDLTHNFIERLENFTNTNMPKLNTLILAENKIINWQQPIICKSSIQELTLSKNLINEITPIMANDFKASNLTSLDVTDNPFMCYCTMKNLNSSLPQLISWPQGYKCQSKLSGTKRYILIHLENITEENCLKTVESREKDRYDGNTSHSKTALSAVSVASALAISIGVVALCYWKRWHIYTCARMLRTTALFSIIENEDGGKSKKEKKFQYDVFVSYSDPDRRWIMDHLLPNLEGNAQIKVCLHERDFQAGVSILENIMACMEQSRCVLLVISQAFLRSHWCLFELNMAQHRLLQMNRDHLLLVLLENIPREQCTKMMRYIMLSKTYLQWPIKNPEEQQQFWKRLQKAVGCRQDTTISEA